MSNDDSASFVILHLQEAHNRVRNSSERMNEHVRFYLLIASALLAGLFIIVESQTDLLLSLITVSLITSFAAAVGTAIFVRICNIKVQATTYVAWTGRWARYFLAENPKLDEYFDAENNDTWLLQFPFTNQIIVLLRGFALFNSLILGVGLLFGISSTRLLTTGTTWNAGVGAYSLYSIPPLLLMLVFSNLYLNSQVRGASRVYSDILASTLPRDADHDTAVSDFDN